MRPMEGGWMPHMARLLLPNTEKLHIPSARCIIHALLECMCGLETRTDDGKSCTQVNHKWEIFFFSFYMVIVVGMYPFNQLAAVKSLGCYVLFSAHSDLIWNQILNMQHRFSAIL